MNDEKTNLRDNSILPIENASLEDSKKWFKQAGSGLFVHWGLYALPAGEWKGEKIPWLGEWIMHSAKIPVKKYERLAAQFNPSEFNAREWVELAEKAGMRYLVFTAKHHEGFAMYHSKADRYNIVDASPFKRDPLAELAEACRGTKVKLGVYYSQAMDWHEPSACNAPCDKGYGNNWDFSPGTPEGFSEYMDRKAKPQIKELLTQYGPIAMMWFDNPMPSFTAEHAKEVKHLVRALQPGCLISARIGHGLGDIQGFGDNYLPEDKMHECLSEACITMNDTWGYKKDGGRWKSSQELLKIINQSASMNCNLLLNVGPMADGRFPPEAINRLEQIAKSRLYS